MRRTGLIVAVVAFLLTLPSAGAREFYIPIAGSAGIFRTDARIFNPSHSENLVLDAYLLPIGNIDNSVVVPVEITIGPREMRVFDDVVAEIFNAGGLAGIRLVSPGETDFLATARIYAQMDVGTLGQFAVGQPLDLALQKGILLQLDDSPAFRTNIGFLNPSASMKATVNLRLYDKENDLVGAEVPLVIEPLGVIGPTRITNLFSTSGADISDSWISFESDTPIFGYASVVDEETEDQTYIPAGRDSGVATASGSRIFSIEAHQDPDVNGGKGQFDGWSFDVYEDGALVCTRCGATGQAKWSVRKGDHVTLMIKSLDTTHGFFMDTYVSGPVYSPSDGVITVEFDATIEGDFFFACTVPTCGDGHLSMTGKLTVGRSSTDPPDGPGY